MNILTAMIYKKTKLINILAISAFFIIGCKKKDDNYITYYNKINEIDSIYRIAGKPELAIKKYDILFKDYSPKNQEYIEEYETYIKLSENHHLDFGGKKSLYRLISLIAPSGDKYKKYLSLFQKYRIDEKEVRQEVSRYKNNLNHKLIDSLTIACQRDKETNRRDLIIMQKNDNKNLNLFLQIFDRYGYPSEKKVGTAGNDGEPLITATILSHLICLDYNKIYPRLLEYLKTGEIPPRMFALIVDKYYLCTENKHYYNISGTSSHEDSLMINRRRKTIGLPSLIHYSKIRKDYFDSK